MPRRNPEDSMAYKFESNSMSFQIDYEVVDNVKGHFPHTGITTSEGISVLFRRDGDSNWLNINSYASDSPINIDMSHFVEEDEIYEILIYGPILSQLKKLEVTVPDDSYSNIVDLIPERNIIVVGGFISFGLGCTTTGCMFSNILERKFDANVSHLSFNSFDYLKNVYDFYENHNPNIADVGIIELDNFGQHESVISEVLPKLIPLMKQRCKHLIGWYSISDKKAFKKIIANNTVRDYINNGDLEIIDISFLYGDEYKDMCVFGDYYINDAGNIIIFKKLEEKIRGLTKWKN